MRKGFHVPQPANHETSTVYREHGAASTLEITGGQPSGPQNAVGPRSRGTYVAHQSLSGVASKDALPQKPRGGHPLWIPRHPPDRVPTAGCRGTPRGASSVDPGFSGRCR